MTYSTGEANVLTRLRAMTQWDASNTSRQNWNLLNSGKSAAYAILRPGEYIVENVGIGQTNSRTTWNTVIEVWQAYNQQGTDPIELQGLVDDIIRELEKYPYLGAGTGGTIQNAVITGGGEMQERWTEGNARSWAYWEVNVAWTEERTITPAE